VSDSAGQSATRSYTGNVTTTTTALTLHTTELSTITATVPFTYNLAVSGGTTPYTFSATGIPTGLSLNAATGLISGTPVVGLANQPYAFTVTVVDAHSASVQRVFSGTVEGGSSASVNIVNTTLPTPTAGSSYLAAIGVTGGTPPYAYSITSGTLPTGLSLDAGTGLISGNVAHSTTGGAYLFTVTVTDTAMLTDSQIYNGMIGAYTLSMFPASMINATPGSMYGATITTTGGQAPYTYALTSGSLPTGLSLNTSTGVISGTVAEANAGSTANFNIRVTDVNNVQATTSYSIVTSAFPLTITTASLNDANENIAYTNGGTPLAATGGTGPYTYEYTGSLPSGVGLTSGGVFFGTPTVGSGVLSPGTAYNISVRARDTLNQVSALTPFTLRVVVNEPSIVAGTPTTAVLGSAYNYSFSATGGRAPYTFTLASGSLPTGLSMSAAGVVTGTAVASATCPANQFNIQVTDVLSQVSAQATRCIATLTGVSITTSTLNPVISGTVYNQPLSVSGGTAPYSFVASSLPSGISINASTGTLSGFVNDPPADYTSYITVTDSSSPAYSQTRTFTVRVINPLSITTASVANGAIGQVYATQNLAATGGTTPYTFTVTSGSLPPGLTLAGNGTLSGTPASSAAIETGVHNFQVSITDANGLSSTPQAYSIRVSVPPKIDDTSLPPALLSRPYAHTMKRRGGVNPFISAANLASQITWGATGLPDGLTINTASGKISGTPSSAVGSPFSVDFTVTDSLGVSTSKTLNLRVETTGKTLALEAPRFVEPCLESAAAFNCSHSGFDIGKLVNAQPTQNYLVYPVLFSGTVAAPVSRIYIARLQSDGRYQSPGTGNLIVSWVPSVQGYITSVDLADIDNDGHIDIVYSDHTNNRITVVWNSGTVNGNGMPVFTDSNHFDMPGGGTGRVSFVKQVQLRPDATNSNKKDLIAMDIDYANAASIGRFVVFLASNDCATDCSGSRSTVYTDAGASITAYDTILSGIGQPMIYTHTADIGYFNTAPGAGVCPSLVTVGRRDNSTVQDYAYLRHQSFGGGVCDGNFSINDATDRKLTSTGNNIPGQGISVADLNNDGISDIALTLRGAAGSSASLLIYLMPGGNVFPANPIRPLLPNTTGVAYAASHVLPYCLDGSLSCDYPSLIVMGNRGRYIGSTGTYGFMSIFPNQGAPPYFEDLSGEGRIDYAAPQVQTAMPVALPLIGSAPTRNDIVLMGYGSLNYPFYAAYERNGSSTTRPFKGLMPLRSFPEAYNAGAEVGTLRLADVNANGQLELVSHLYNQTAMSVHKGDLTANTGVTIPPPIYHSLAVSHGWPTGYFMPQTMALGDFNNDGYLDAVVTGHISRAIAVSMGKSDGTFGTSTLVESSLGGDVRPYSLVVDDFDQDGHLDIITSNYNAVTLTSDFSFLKGKGDGSFHDPVEFFSSNGIGAGSGVTCSDIRSIASVDIDGDSRPEIMALCYSLQALFVARRHTNGNWIKNNGTALSQSGTNGTTMRVGRLTSTAGIDAVIGGLSVTQSMRIISNIQISGLDANGTFNATSTNSSYISLNGWTSDFEIADLNEDGYGDIIATMQSGNKAATSAGGNIFYTCALTAQNTCTPQGWGTDIYGVTGIAVGDVNYDGRPDIFLGSRLGNRIFYRMIHRYLNSSF
jgi:hypothetical protein